MQHRLLLVFLLALATLAPPSLHAQPTARTLAPPYYSLPPAKLAKSRALSRDFTAIHFVVAGWSILSLTILIAAGIIRRLRDTGVRLTRHYWLQGPIFFGLLLLLRTALNLPISVFAHHLAVGFGLSVQGWPAWAADVLKSLGLTFVVGSLIVLLLFACIRRWPQRWWLAFWAALVPMVFAGAFLVPIVIDPLFDHFTPLQQVDPALAASLEQVVARAHVDIPLGNMYVMRASDKYTGLNAYVTGIGASKRVVVWDTTVAKAPTDVIQIVFAHELGHYVLHHVLIGTSLALGGLLVFFWIAHKLLNLLLARYGTDWGIADQQDWAALAVLVLLLSIASFISEPISNGISRRIEHNADVYGQEAMHGIIPNPQATDVESFQILGEAGLDDPSPNPFVEFWIYNHPSTTHRAEFAAHYDPWLPGGHPKYFPK